MTEPATAIVPCPYCAERIQQGAALCRFCGRQVPVSCASIIRVGTQYALGRLTTGGLGVWDTQASSALVAQYPDTQAAWQEASQAFEHAESNTRRTVSTAGGQHVAGRSRQPIAIIVILVILIGGYLFIHAHKYENCIITPSVLAWPSECF